MPAHWHNDVMRVSWAFSMCLTSFHVGRSSMHSHTLTALSTPPVMKYPRHCVTAKMGPLCAFISWRTLYPHSDGCKRAGTTKCKHCNKAKVAVRHTHVESRLGAAVFFFPGAQQHQPALNGVFVADELRLAFLQFFLVFAQLAKLCFGVREVVFEALDFHF